MQLHLPAWGNAWIAFKVDPATGVWTKSPRKPKELNPEEVLGFASLEPVWGIRKRFYACYATAGKLYFQAGHRRWDVTHGVECKVWFAGYGMASGLILHFQNGESHRSVLIHPWKAFMPILDPTYDGMDAEDDNFFLFLQQQLPKTQWREAFLARSRNWEARNATV